MPLQSLGHQIVRPCYPHRGQDEHDMNNRLPHHACLGVTGLFGAQHVYCNERLQQVY